MGYLSTAPLQTLHTVHRNSTLTVSQVEELKKLYEEERARVDAERGKVAEERQKVLVVCMVHA